MEKTDITALIFGTFLDFFTLWAFTGQILLSYT